MRSLSKLPFLPQWFRSIIGLVFWDTRHLSRRMMNDKRVRMTMDLNRPVNDMLNAVHEESSRERYAERHQERSLHEKE